MFDEDKNTIEKLAEANRDLTVANRERDRYKMELERLQKRIQNMAVPPLNLAIVTKILEENYVTIYIPSGRHILTVSPFENLKIHDIVAVDQQTLKIVRIIPPQVSEEDFSQFMTRLMKVTTKIEIPILRAMLLMDEFQFYPILLESVEKLGLRIDGSFLILNSTESKNIQNTSTNIPIKKRENEKLDNSSQASDIKRY